jgi:hypothetical protein
MHSSEALITATMPRDHGTFHGDSFRLQTIMYGKLNID